MLPGKTITRIASKPDDAETVLVSVASTGHGHIFRSDDGGDTWSDVDQSDLPDVPFHSLVIPTSKPRTVYACGDAGVFASSFLGGNWKNATGNLPTTMMVDLVFQDADRTLSVATYGRSSWRVRL